MKPRSLILVTTLVLVFIVVLAGCATGNKAYKKSFKEEVVGTWINPDYENRYGHHAKVVIKPDGMYEGYPNAQDTEFKFGLLTITDRWIDSEGNIFYKALADNLLGTIKYELWKLSKSGTVFEYVWDNLEYPTDINPDGPGYRIIYRQQNVFTPHQLCIWYGILDKINFEEAGK